MAQRSTNLQQQLQQQNLEQSALAKMVQEMAKIKPSEILSSQSSQLPTTTYTQVIQYGGPSSAAPPQPPKREVKPSMDNRRPENIAEIRYRDLEAGDKLRHAGGLNATVNNHPGNSDFWLVVDENGNQQASWSKIGQNKIKNENWNLILKAVGVGFESVILAEDKKQQITDAISQVDNHKLIFDEWGFGEVFEKGTAISLLFYGPPGTGKTLMAQAIADKYHRQLKMISTAEIETPEPGGAERNLQRAFAEAQSNKSVLLFDECDSLITDRGRVGMILAAQINALLTELERYTGIVIFTTNRLGALDPAFDRRLSLKLEFPMPDAKHRVHIWKRMFPEKCPLAKDIRWEDLAQIEIAGGHIKNVVLKAARKAAAGGHKEITDAILWECLEKEVESLEAYSDALNSHNPMYGRPIQGGVGALGASTMNMTQGRFRELRNG